MWRAGLVSAATCWAALALPASAFAGEPEVAEQLFREGHALLEQQRYLEACPKFAESELHDPASGTLLALAYCQELAGWIASARASYARAAGLAQQENQPERERAANERAAALAPRASTLTINVPSTLLQLPSLRVSQNGIDVARTDLNASVTVDGGVYAVTVTATGREPWSTRVTIGPERDHVTVSVPESAALPVAPLLRANTAHLDATLLQPSEPAPRYWTTPRVLGWTAVGVGAVSGVISAVFAVETKTEQHAFEADIRASEGQTSPTGTTVPWDSSGHTHEVVGKRDAALAQGFGIASGALLVSGAALVLFGSEAHEHAPANLSLAITPGAAQLGYSGSF